MSHPTSIPHVAHVELLRGSTAPPETLPSLLVEVPHGADERPHYDHLRDQLQGDYPDGLEIFFHVNTDVAAYAYGRATAQAFLDAHPDRAALVVRCLIPRTFVDCNRPADFTGSDLTQGGLTAGVPAYVTHDPDRAHLLDLHRQYVTLVQQAYQAVLGPDGPGGVALVPHTYAPRTVGIQHVDARIVESLRWAYEPERYATWTIRAEVDLLTRDGDGLELAPPHAEANLLRAFRDASIQAEANEAYYLHPSTLAHTWSTQYPGRVLCLEVRRDLLVTEWTPFDPMTADPARVAPFAAILAPELTRILTA